MWKVLDIFTPSVSSNYQDKQLNCREEIVQHSNLKVKWDLRKSGRNLSGREGASLKGELFPSLHEEEQQRSIWDSMTLHSSSSLFTFPLRMSVLGFHHVPTLLHYWSDGIYRYIFFKMKRRIKHFIFCEKQDTRKIDPTKILFFLT